MTIESNVQELSPGSIVTFVEMDLTVLGGLVYYFHNGTNELKSSVIWQGNTYTPFPVELTGFDVSSEGAMARPILRLANIGGLIGAIIQGLGDITGGKITRKRTMVKYLDAVNFTGGVNPTEDPNVFFSDDLYFIDRKTSENKIYIEFELVSSLDVSGIKLPRRQIIQNSCTWIYRSGECSYAGGAVADINDNPTGDIDLDVCGKRLNSCELRFGTLITLPYGGFPGAGLLG
jgi:lambda family phage minor tail protein L